MPMLAVTKIICDRGDLIEGSAVGSGRLMPRARLELMKEVLRVQFFCCALEKWTRRARRIICDSVGWTFSAGAAEKSGRTRPFRQYGVLDSP
jgi:hypothetical protein